MFNYLFIREPIAMKKYIHLYQCKPGDVIVYDVYDQYGFLIAAKNTVVSEYIINRLNIFNIRQLSVYEFNGYG